MTDFYKNFCQSYQAVDFSQLALCQLKFWSLADVAMMTYALALAKRGAKQGEVPVGAVVVHHGDIIGEGYNQPISTHDPTAHAEIIAIRQACQTLHNYRLPPDSTLYVTLEPCTMCFGLLVHARVARVVFGTSEPKSGVVVSQLNLPNQTFYNHKIAIHDGLLANKSSMILSEFFRQKRQQKRLNKPTP